MTQQYSIIRFSPNPEEIERVGVAIYLWATGQMIYDKEFPRLRCLAPGFNTAMLLYHLEYLHKGLAASKDSQSPEQVLISPQFSLEKPRALISTDSQVLDLLKSRYLGRATGKQPKRESVYKQIETRLQDFITSITGIPDSAFIKRAHPRDFLPSSLASQLEKDKIIIPRVLNGKRHLVTISALNLSDPRPDHLLRDAGKSSYSFFRLGQLRSEIDRLEKRELTRIMVVFDRDAASDDPHSRFVGRDADLTAAESAPPPELKLKLLMAASDILTPFNQLS